MTTIGRPRPKRTLACACLLILAPASAGATQQPAAATDPREAEYTKACASGDVDKGVKILGELYAETLEPVLVYNQGRCYQQNGRPREAITRFREYLRKAQETTPAERTEVEGFIKELEAELAASERKPDQDARLTTTAVIEPAPKAGLSRLEIAGIATAAGGVLAMGLGAYFGWRTMTAEEQVEDRVKGMYRVDAAVIRDDLESGGSYQTLQFVGYGIGVAALAAGTTMYFVGRRGRMAATERVTFVPVVGPLMAGGFVGARF